MQVLIISASSVWNRKTVLLLSLQMKVTGSCPWALLSPVFGPGEQSTRGGQSWMTVDRRGAGPPGKKVLFPGKDGKGRWAEEDTRCSLQTASEYIILSTNACPIKGQFRFLTWYQINCNSDNYSGEE